MGTGHSTEVHIRFDRPHALYYPGQRVTGTVLLYTRAQMIKLQSIVLQLVGECCYTTPDIYHYLDETGSPQEDFRVVRRCAPFLNITCPVLQLKGSKYVEVPRHGQCSWPFEFVLPPYLPPSTGPVTTAGPCVRYYTRLVLDKSWYQRSIKQVYPLMIFPRVNLFRLEHGRRSSFECCSNRQNLQLHAFLHRRGVLPGENISLDVDVKNPERLHIEKTEAKLIQHHKVVSDYRKETILEVDLPALLNFTDAELHHTVDLRVPLIPLTPTYQCTVKCKSYSALISIYYELKLTMTIRNVPNTISFSIPILVGTEAVPEPPPSSSFDIDYLDLPISYEAAMEETEPPPDYERAVRLL